MNPQLSDILKNGKLPTRKDLNTKRGNDIIIFRLNVEGGIDNKQHTKTIFGHKDFLDKYHYWCEDFSDYSYIDGKTNTTSFKIDDTIAKFIQNNMEEIKKIGELEETEGFVNDGYTTELYFSDGKEGRYFCYEQGYNYKGENMKKLRNLKEKIEKMLQD